MGFATTGAADKTMFRRLSMLEPVLVYALIMLYIWWLRFAYRPFWMLILGIILLSHHYHRERAGTLGFQWKNFGRCAVAMAPMLLFSALALLSAGILMRTVRDVSFDDGVLSFAAYFPWGLFQQYLLNGYFVNRFSEAWPARYAPLLSAACFSGAHLPNWFLMVVTFAGGYACARVYRRYRNLYFLGVAHATIGFLLFLVVPDSISRHLNVGPGWFR